MEKKLFAKRQSCFIARNSCVTQLLSITHEICKSFDCNPPVDISTFLVISNAFDKVSHEGLTPLLKSYGIGGNLSKLLENYLQNRKQGITLNGEMSSLENILVGVLILCLATTPILNI